MRAAFELNIGSISPSSVELRLFDQAGGRVAQRHVDFERGLTAAHRLGLFDLRNYLSLYIEPLSQARAMADLGVCIAKDVLGPEIFSALSESEEERTLCIRLADTISVESRHAAQFLNLPWELARIMADHLTLGESKLAIHVAGSSVESTEKPLALGAGEPLRVLFVFSQTWGTRALGARKEWRALRRLFNDEIASDRLVVADFLTTDVTLDRLTRRLLRSREFGGYHVVHWSGHGGPGGLRIASSNGFAEDLTGEALLAVFREATGTVPQLFFLAACQSAEDTAATVGHPAGMPGGVGVAQAMVAQGVPSVIAMRYSVGDEYARDLAVSFYRELLTGPQTQNAVGALAAARLLLLRGTDPSRYYPSDHATPVFYGVDVLMTTQMRDAPVIDDVGPKLLEAGELTAASHEHFVGRFRELTVLATRCFDAGHWATPASVATITGLGGSGKTALVAEALDLWAGDFRWAAAYTAKPLALPFETMLGALHQLLYAQPESEYHRRLKVFPDDSIYRDQGPSIPAQEHQHRAVDNFLRTLRSDAILIVLDNFETNLTPVAARDGGVLTPQWSCLDPAWEEFLSRAPEELAGSPSRILITSRRPISALAGQLCATVRLGPLADDEVDLYFRDHPRLAQMVASLDPVERALAADLRASGRGHPLILDRLARLATSASRSKLPRAFELLNRHFDSSQPDERHPDVRDDEFGLGDLEDALAAMNDQALSELASLDRLLLWVVALAGEPVSRDLLSQVWSRGGSVYTLQEIFGDDSGDGSHADQPIELELRPFDRNRLGRLVALGLVLELPRWPGDPNPGYVCHELVREHIRIWMTANPGEAADWTEDSVLIAFAERFEARFRSSRQQNMKAALEAGRRATVLYARARAFDHLASIAREVVAAARDPRLMQGLIPYLEAAAHSASEVRGRSCLLPLAVAMTIAGRPGSSLIVFEQAASLAEIAVGSEEAEGGRPLADLYAILGNWAHALREVGALDDSRRRHLESADAARRAGLPAVNVIGAELEAFRCLILAGGAAKALPEIDERLAQVKNWHLRRQAGDHLDEAPDAMFLARVFIGALDLARQAQFALKEWKLALGHIDTMLSVKASLGMPDQDLVADRGNRAIALRRLGRLDEARVELERGLPVMKGNPASLARLLGSLALVFEEQQDLTAAMIQERRALAIRETLSSPRDRAISHFNLARYLRNAGGEASFRTESSQHQLAALVYQLRTGLKSDFHESLEAYAEIFRHTPADRWDTIAPRLEQLLAQPSFQMLASWLAERNEDLKLVQTQVDEAISRSNPASPPMAS